MHLHPESSFNAHSDCCILSLSWMGKVPDDMPEDEGWKLNRVHYYQEGWLATGNARGIVGVTYTTSHSKKASEIPPRTNYNLRGHRAEVTLVKWNEPYQKLATCDSSGIIFVWIKYEGRWSIELINDRNTPVTHFSWSHDGRMALICYQDGFVLVGSVAGQRYWSSMLSLQSTITSGVFTPEDQQVYFGTTSGLVIVMDIHGAMVAQVPLLDDTAITDLAWSCPKFKMEEAEESAGKAGEAASLLAVVFQTGLVYLLRNHDDLTPTVIRTGLRGVQVEWTNSGEVLAVGGHLPDEGCTVGAATSNPVRNVVKFYTRSGSLRYTHHLPLCQNPVTALTWGHNDKRVFVATGSQLHIGRVSRRVASLQLLCRLAIKGRVREEDKVTTLPLPRRLKALVTSLYTQTIRCYIPDARQLRDFVSRPPVNGQRLHCTMIRHDEDLVPTPGACYTLYLEYLGGLVPLLKGKRTSKIRPEFVIFDPQADEALSKENGERGGSVGACGPGGVLLNGHPAFSDTSDTEYEDMCASPRLQRRRKLKRRIRERLESETDELVYLDTLPEQNRLVEVTSNIWGTKFKLHGIASSLPANLGQVTYKTSLLHLQPRQMTLVITELREDIPPRPDPNFNPNVFSEDEEELGERLASRRPPDLTSDVPPIAPMTPRRTPSSYSRQGLHSTPWDISSPPPPPPPPPPPTRQPPPEGRGVEGGGGGGGTDCVAADADGASLFHDLLEEHPYVDLATPEMLQLREGLRAELRGEGHAPQHLHLPPSQANPPRGGESPPAFSVVRGSTPSSPKHSVSAFCCDAGTIQSPKNIVAPTPALAIHGSDVGVVTAGRAGLKATPNAHAPGRATRLEELRVVASDAAPLLQHYANVSSSSSSSNSSSNSFSVNNNNNLNNNNINISNTAYHSSSNSSSNSSSGNSTYRSPQHSQGCSGVVRGDVIRYIDEESGESDGRSFTPSPARSSSGGGGGRPRPLLHCRARSKSVGHLHSMDHSLAQLPHLHQLRSIDAFLAFRRSGSLVDSPKKRQVGESHPRRPCLADYGKSRSLDSSPFIIKKRVSHTCHGTIGNNINNNNNNNNNPPLASITTTTTTTVTTTTTIAATTTTTTTTADLHHHHNHSSYDKQQRSFNRTLKESVLVERLAALQRECQQNPPPTPRHQPTPEAARRLNTPTHTPTISSAHASKSIPSTPVKTRKARRHQSSSPIRKHLLNSPLLARRRQHRSAVESSDDEPVHCSSDAEVLCSSSNYRDLETFQKTQLRNKLRRSRGRSEGSGGSGGDSSGSSTPRHRQYVMHNKAPLWNENSQVYQLDFGGRVTQESAKNFQIEFKGKQVMQFGRIDGNAYTLDFQYPFSAVQAFAVALANVTQRLK